MKLFHFIIQGDLVNKGLFITIEGPDGAGKSTQIPFIKRFLEEKGYEVLLTREPGGTIIGEKIRDLILDKGHQEMSDVTEALLYAASRAQHVAELIIPAINEGKIVLCDRFVDSSIAYQGKGRSLGLESVRDINDFATVGLKPDITIFLDIDPEMGLKRVKATKELDRLEQEKLDFHRKVYEGYMELIHMYPERIKVISANQSIEEISKEIEIKLKTLIGEE